MTSLGLPVPAGVTLSTELCNALLAANRSLRDDAALRATVLEALARVEKSQGAKLGDPANPLLVSVRSGARASMPGMMDTILNLGMNDAVAEGLAKKTESPRFAYDAYRRFLAMYADVALGVKRELFEHAARGGAGRVAKAKGDRHDAAEQRGATDEGPRLGAVGRGAAASSRRSRRIVKRRQARTSRRDPHEQLWGADRRGVPLLEKPPRHRLPPYERHPRRVGDGVQHPGDGLRQPRRHERDRRRLHARPVDRARSTSTASGCRTRRARTSSPGSARRRNVGAHRRDGEGGLARGEDAGGLQGVRRRGREAREALPRRAGHRVHGAGRQALHPAVSLGEADGARRCADGRWRWRRRGSSRRRRRSSASTRRQSTSSCTRRSTRTRRRSLLARGLAGEPGRGAGAHRLQRRRGRAPRGAGQAGHPRAHRDVAGGHPRDEGGPRASSRRAAG